MKKAFTLAEIMIVLMVIGILTAILLPSARNAMPNQDVMKFKKAHNALHTAIRELVNSDKYYLDGDLGIKADGTLIDGTHDGDNTYLCQTMADVLNVEKVDCMTKSDVDTGGGWSEQYGNFEEQIDTYCMLAQQNENRSIEPDKGVILQDGTAIYEGRVSEPFGMIDADNANKRRFIERKVDPVTGFTDYYKVICLDIDGVQLLESHQDCKGLCPFGYGVRYDGKIRPGKLAFEWLEKTINQKD